VPPTQVVQYCAVFRVQRVYSLGTRWRTFISLIHDEEKSSMIDDDDVIDR